MGVKNIIIMKKLLFTLALLVSFSSFGQINNAFQERYIENFENLMVSGNFNVEISDSIEGKILVKADDKIIDDIITEIKNNSLIIRKKKRSYLNRKDSYWKEVRIIIPQNPLRKISLSGSGEIFNTSILNTSNCNVVVSGSGKVDLSIKANTLDLDNSGSGTMVLRGFAEKIDINISGSGISKLENLKVKNCDVNISGSGRANINCAEKIEASISGSGTITYFDKSLLKIHTKVSGSGSAKPITLNE